MTRERFQKFQDKRADSVAPDEDTERRGRESMAVDSSAVLELLGDEHTRDVLHAVAERARNASEIADRAMISKPTAYRRLNRLEDEGLVTSRLVIDPDGNHHKRYRAAFEKATFRLDGDEFGLEVEVSSVDRGRNESSEPQSALACAIAGDD